MAIYRIFNFAGPTTVAPSPVATGTALKTMLQIASGATKPLKVKGWGCSFDGSAAATPGTVELIETDVAATVTASVLADLNKIDGEALVGGSPVTNLIPVGTTSTGYTASGEGSITATRLMDCQLIAPTNQYIFQYPLGQEPIVQISKFLRVRAKFAVTVNMICWVDVEV